VCAQPNSKATRGQQATYSPRARAAKPLPPAVVALGESAAAGGGSIRQSPIPPYPTGGEKGRFERSTHPPTHPPGRRQLLGEAVGTGGGRTPAATGWPSRASARKAMGSGLGTAASVNPGASSQPARSSTYAFTRAAAAAAEKKKVMGRQEAA